MSPLACPQAQARSPRKTVLSQKAIDLSYVTASSSQKRRTRSVSEGFERPCIACSASIDSSEKWVPNSQDHASLAACTQNGPRSASTHQLRRPTHPLPSTCVIQDP